MSPSSPARSRRIAIVGGGVAGLVTAYVLSRRHDVTVYEAAARPGGHAHTVNVAGEDGPLAIDTGFVVFNDRNYANFSKLLRQLDVAAQPSNMSFSVSCARTGVEYRGSSEWRHLFAQRRNLLRPRFLRMVRDIVRFNREAPAILETPGAELTLGSFLSSGRYGRELIEHYLVPMGAALWSADPASMLDFPARYFVEFFRNHGFFDLRGRPEWLVVEGGSREYVDRLVEPFRDRLRLATPVQAIQRTAGRVIVETAAGERTEFHDVVIGAHSTRALAMLGDATADETAVLSAIGYQPNDVVLHSDASVMPRSQRAWASWNYHVPKQTGNRATVSYHMNRLQDLPGDRQFFITLNRTDAIDPARVHRKFVYHHPIYDVSARAAQQRWREINGVRNTWFCGAYWGYGFHEDGVSSALRVCSDFGMEL